MFGGGWRIGRIGGVEVRVDPSLLLIGALITFNLWISFAQRFPLLSSGGAVGLAMVTAVLFFASILIHELAHAGMSRVRRIPVLGITLWMFGGATHAKVEARGPADEFLITVVGPLSSAALGLGFRLVGGADALGRPVSFMFTYLGAINLILAAFNLLPGFPLDGGRLLRSGLWKFLGNLSRATTIAARVGQAVALLIVAYGLFLAIDRQALAVGLWPALIGWFLFRAASESLAEEARRGRLRATRAADVMSAPPPTVPGDLSIASALDRYLDGHDGEAFPVMESGRVVGFVSLESARKHDPGRPVRDALILGVEGAVQARPQDGLDEVLDRMGEQRGKMVLRTVLVVDDGRVMGVIEPEDLERELRGRPRAPVPPPPPDH
jgi:Zn-dependent protease/predicted transcriptional regulator